MRTKGTRRHTRGKLVWKAGHSQRFPNEASCHRSATTFQSTMGVARSYQASGTPKYPQESSCMAIQAPLTYVVVRCRCWSLIRVTITSAMIFDEIVCDTDVAIHCSHRYRFGVVDLSQCPAQSGALGQPGPARSWSSHSWRLTSDACLALTALPMKSNMGSNSRRHELC